MPLRHEKLVAWQKADDLYIVLHSLTRQRFPPEERYELSAQLRKASFSIAANLAEGFARAPGRDRLHFIRTSWGSLAEVAYCLHVARRLKYLDDHTFELIDAHARRVGALVMGLLRAELKRVRSFSS